jgi:hypothetical protein
LGNRIPQNGFSLKDGYPPRFANYLESTIFANSCPQIPFSK